MIIHRGITTLVDPRNLICLLDPGVSVPFLCKKLLAASIAMAGGAGRLNTVNSALAQMGLWIIWPIIFKVQLHQELWQGLLYCC